MSCVVYRISTRYFTLQKRIYNVVWENKYVIQINGAILPYSNDDLQKNNDGYSFIHPLRLILTIILMM